MGMPYRCRRLGLRQEELSSLQAEAVRALVQGLLWLRREQGLRRAATGQKVPLCPRYSTTTTMGMV